MIIRTAKGFHRAATFSALARWQQEFQGALASIEIGPYSVDVSDSDDTAGSYAIAVRSELADQIRALGHEAIAAGDDDMARDAERALDLDDGAALERCCEAICDAYAQAD